MSTLLGEIKKRVQYTIMSANIKSIMFKLDWVNEENFKIDNSPPELVNKKFQNFLWIERMDILKKTTKVVFSMDAIDPIVLIVNDRSAHKRMFDKELQLKK